MIGLLIVAAGGYALWRLYKAQTTEFKPFVITPELTNMFVKGQTIGPIVPRGPILHDDIKIVTSKPKAKGGKK